MKPSLLCFPRDSYIFFNFSKLIYNRFSLYLFFLLIFSIVIPQTAVAAGTTYLDELLHLAHQKKLHETRYWHILLHYEKGLFGTQSLIDDPDFFLAKNGKYDPEAELIASIKTFFKENVTKDDFPVCQFIARYTWLKEELSVDGSKVPVFECEKINQLNPKSASLIFPTYFMNNPASMFGHTLINIETDFANKLLTKSVNYSASTDETNGILFAVKGLLGFYKGHYSTLPYYKKIQQYSDISQRDIWEYHLNLTADEIDRMVRHIRELEDIYADYFFFDENCSYSLLYLLEAARPSIHLTDKFSRWVIPIDTIKETKKSGLIEKVVFRPSKTSKIQHKISLLNENEKRIALEIIKGKRSPESVLDLEISKKKQIIIIDLVVEYISYKYVKKKITQDQYKATLLNALKFRSQLGKLDEPYNYPVPPRPDQIHESGKFYTGFGVNTDESFFEMGYKPAFSDLLDTDLGYNQGTQVEFFDINFRYYLSEKKFKLNSLDLIDIMSISPRDRFFKPLSWKVKTGVYQELMEDGEESVVYKLNTGSGFAYNFKPIGLCYMFVEPEFQCGSDLKKDYALGGGFSVGIVKEVFNWWKLHLSGRQIYFKLGDIHNTGVLSLKQHFVLRKNSRIQIDISREKAFKEYNTEAKINFCFYF